MTESDIYEHAERYSQTYRSYMNGNGKGGVWVENFEAMALKTVMKLLLSKQAPLSVEMQQAVLADQSVVKDAEKGEFDYPDNQIEDAEFILNVNEEDFAKCKQSIQAGETTLQDLCDNGFEFSQQQYAELEKLENELSA
ncbi:hypothetical protein O1Q83_01777 [Lonepinella koalarum]